MGVDRDMKIIITKTTIIDTDTIMITSTEILSCNYLENKVC